MGHEGSKRRMLGEALVIRLALISETQTPSEPPIQSWLHREAQEGGRL